MVRYITLYGEEEMLWEESMLDFYWKEKENEKVEDFLLSFQEGEIFVLVGEKIVQSFNFNYINTKGALFFIKELNSQDILCIGACGEKIAIPIYYLLQKCIELIKRESILYEQMDYIHKKFNCDDIGSLIASLNNSRQPIDINYAEKYININNEINKINERKENLEKTIQSITFEIIENNESRIKEITKKIYNLIPTNIYDEFEEKYK